MKLREYLEKHPELKSLFLEYSKYLPGLDPDNIVVHAGCLPPDVQQVQESESIRVVVKGVTKHNEVWFADDPPSQYVFTHELVHLSGVLDEAWTGVVHAIVEFAVKRNLPPFDARKIVGIGLRDLDEVARALGFESALDLTTFAGILLSDVTDTVFNPSGDFMQGFIKQVPKPDVPEEMVVLRVLHNAVSGALDGEPVFTIFVEKLVTMKLLGGVRSEEKG